MFFNSVDEQMTHLMKELLVLNKKLWSLLFGDSILNFFKDLIEMKEVLRHIIKQFFAQGHWWWETCNEDSHNHKVI